MSSFAVPQGGAFINYLSCNYRLAPLFSAKHGTAMSDNVEAALCFGCHGSFPLRDMTQRLISVDTGGRVETVNGWVCDSCEVNIPDEIASDKKEVIGAAIIASAALLLFFGVILLVIYAIFETDLVFDGDSSEKAQYLRLIRLILHVITLGRKAVAVVFL